MKWIKLKDRQPDIDIDGDKILLYRILNSGQEAMSISIFSTRMTRCCDEETTWWMSLPVKPII